MERNHSAWCYKVELSFFFGEEEESSWDFLRLDLYARAYRSMNDMSSKHIYIYTCNDFHFIFLFRLLIPGQVELFKHKTHNSIPFFLLDFVLCGGWTRYLFGACVLIWIALCSENQVFSTKNSRAKHVYICKWMYVQSKKKKWEEKADRCHFEILECVLAVQV